MKLLIAMELANSPLFCLPPGFVRGEEHLSGGITGDRTIEMTVEGPFPSDLPRGTLLSAQVTKFDDHMEWLWMLCNTREPIGDPIRMALPTLVAD